MNLIFFNNEIDNLKNGFHGRRELVFEVWSRNQTIKHKEWRRPGSPEPTKMRSEKSGIKIILSKKILNSQSIVHKEFLLEGTTSLVAGYVGILERLLQCISLVGHLYGEQKASWFLLHNDARPHTACSAIAGEQESCVIFTPTLSARFVSRLFSISTI